jgi:hypothetical protein
VTAWAGLAGWLEGGCEVASEERLADEGFSFNRFGLTGFGLAHLTCLEGAVIVGNCSLM